jgi:hypothetical protein
VRALVLSFGKKILHRPFASRSSFVRASSGLTTHRHICSVTLLLWSVLSSALAQDIPSGFKVDRYVQVWERNPFTLVKPAAPERLPSAFEKLFLASWLKDGGEEVVLVQNSETNEVQRITAVPNHNDLRLVEMHPNENPQLVEVVLSDGKEQGTVKFRFDVQPSTSQTPLGATVQGSGQIAVEPGNTALANPPSPGPTPTMSRLHPGVLKYHTEGQPGPNSTLKGPTRKFLKSDTPVSPR